MPRFIRKKITNRTNTTEQQVKTGKINVFDVLPNNTEHTISRTIDGLLDLGTRVGIDYIQLMPVLPSLPRYSLQIYIYLASLLQDNRRAIIIHSTELRNKSTDISKRETFTVYLDILTERGLIFRFRSHEFYINPLYLWTGERSQYFDIDRLPFKSITDPSQDETKV